MNNLDKAREAFLNVWFASDDNGGHWTNGMSAKHALSCEAEFNHAFAAAIAAVTADDIPVVETQTKDDQGNWTYTNDQVPAGAETRTLVDLEDVKRALLKQEIFTKVWKTAVEESAVELAKLRERIAAQDNANDDQVDKLEEQIANLTKEREIDLKLRAVVEKLTQCSDDNAIPILQRMKKDADQWDSLQLKPWLTTMFGNAETSEQWQKWLDHCSDIFRRTNEQSSVDFGNELKRFNQVFRKLLKDNEKAYAALAPFAKAGTLYKTRIKDYNETVFNPAAGPEFFITGDDLRRATSLVDPTFEWISVDETE